MYNSLNLYNVTCRKRFSGLTAWYSITRQLKNAEDGRNSLPHGRAHQRCSFREKNVRASEKAMQGLNLGPLPYTFFPNTPEPGSS